MAKPESNTDKRAAIFDWCDRWLAMFHHGNRNDFYLALVALRAAVDLHVPCPVDVWEDGEPLRVYPCESCDHDFNTASACPTIERIYASLGLDTLQEGR